MQGGSQAKLRLFPAELGSCQPVRGPCCLVTNSAAKHMLGHPRVILCLVCATETQGLAGEHLLCAVVLQA